MNTQDYYISLIHQNLTGEIAAHEKTILQQWLASDAANQQLANEMAKLWKLTDDLNQHLHEPQRSHQQQQRDRLMLRIHEISTREKKYRTYRLVAAVWIYIVIAGAIVSFLIKRPMHIQAYTKQQVWLVHNAHVVLNKNSDIGFEPSARFIQANFKGQGFFSFNSKYPATIRFANSSVTADSATFFIQHTEQYAEVIVITGRVVITVNDHTTTLRQNEQAIVNPQQALLVTHFNPNNIGWYSGVWNFKNTTFPEITKALETAFPITFQIEAQEINYATFTGTFIHQDLESILQKLAHAIGFHYTLSNGVCQIRTTRKS